MASTPQPAPAPKEPIDYAKKYWWIGVILMPLMLLLLNKMWPDSKAGAAGSVTNISTVKNEFLTVMGQPLNDPALLKIIEQALASTAKGDTAASITLYQEALKQAPLPSLYNNLGAAYVQINNLGEARKQFDLALARDRSYELAHKNLTALATRPPPDLIHVGAQEQEPNEDVFHANVMPLKKGILAGIAPANDIDTFQFETPGKSRDWIDVILENRDTGLRPALRVMNADKADVVGLSAAPNPGANHSAAFVALPGAKYFVQVTSYNGWSTGAYVITVKPRNAFDRWEPNDDVAHASSISLGSPVEANIMDGGDVDYYTFQSAAAGEMTVTIQNTSTTLAPSARVLDAARSDITGWQANTDPGGHKKFTFKAEAGAKYYVAMGAHNGWSSGSYTLTVR